ncbi:unnamed protein product [Paramecium primaurelia]|uniref:Serine/threonine-protein kinase RIO2 n=1 Tax=Paramecium primaurelia TaxID=5886 RepID=A0A8S1M462_PARPR|nr:unnamed protein product [Paramecium primaurelia]
MRLDTSYLAYLTKDELRVLVAVEMGMKNHEYVPVSLIEKISKVKRANAYQILQQLLKHKLVQHVAKKYDGYRLTYLGYDFLALSAFYKRGTIVQVLSKVGVGKESDIYKCINSDGNFVILKLARLGRTSFRTIKNKRDYIKNRTQYNWLYLSRLASIKEYAYMETCYKNGFPTPKPYDWNRHAIVMSFIDGYTLCSIQELGDVDGVFIQCINLIEKFASHGLIHSDFNEFNLMITEQQKILVIDFPQMVSTQHLNAEFYFQRDLDCINIFFQRRFKANLHSDLKLKDIKVIKHLDHEVKASGFIKSELNDNKELEILEAALQEQQQFQEENENEKFQQDDDDEDNIGQDDDDEDNQDEEGEQDDNDEDKQDNQDDEEDEDDEDEEDDENEEDEENLNNQEDDQKQQEENNNQENKEQQLQDTQIPKNITKITELDQKNIKKFVQKKFRKKMVIKKNINKTKGIEDNKTLTEQALHYL